MISDLGFQSSDFVEVEAEVEVEEELGIGILGIGVLGSLGDGFGCGFRVRVHKGRAAFLMGMPDPFLIYDVRFQVSDLVEVMVEYKDEVKAEVKGEDDFRF